MKLENWERVYFEKPLYDPFIFLVIHGEFNVDFNISQSSYRVAGIPEGIELIRHSPEVNPSAIKSFLTGFLWEELQESDSVLANQIYSAKECFVIRGQVVDTNNLNYLRDIIGITTYLLDHGGVSVYDAQRFTFWNKRNWKQEIFLPNKSLPRNHVVILKSAEENAKSWFHTRGMRKFGRPDISIHHVELTYETTIIDLINRFIEFQAFGGIIQDRQSIKMSALPIGMWCENKGNFEDPDFNNKHVEIHWE